MAVLDAVNGRPRLLVRAALWVALPALLTTAALRLPWPALTAFLEDPAGTSILDRNGELLGVTAGERGAFQEKLPLTEIPAEAQRTFIRMEDRRFYFHPGVDPAALARAVVRGALGRGLSGASTITMQLARLIEPHQRTGFGKAVEMARALALEARLPKSRILELWLNSLPFGRNVVGVGAAAWAYFGTGLPELTSAQLRVLSVIPRNPAELDPFTHPQALIAQAVKASREAGLSVDVEAIAAAVRGARSGRPPSQARHFVRFIGDELASGSLKASHGVIRTTLDANLNSYIEGRVRVVLARYAAARVTNAAVLVIDNETGGVLGWVGSSDYGDAARLGQIDGVLIRRQSASTLKPFLYGLALQRGWTASSLLPDTPLEFATADGPDVFRPVDFDRRARGVVRLRTALASSLNVPAVYLLSRVGVGDFLNLLSNLGFRLPPDARDLYGLGAAIGNAEVSLLELGHAFTLFPRGGTLPELRFAMGQGVSSRRVMDPFSAWLVSDILSDPSARITGFGTRTYFNPPFPALFKSGTSSEFTNLWCVGATPRITVAVWAGNFDGRAVINKTGSVVPAQIALDVLERLTSAPQDFSRPPGVIQARICTVSGQAATDHCPSTRTEYFRSTDRLPPPCDYHGNPNAGEGLLRESLLLPAESARIIFPAAGQVFYRDATLGADSQGIPIAIAARSQAGLTLTLDGRPLSQGQVPLDLSIPATPGQHTLVLGWTGGSDRVSFQVR